MKVAGIVGLILGTILLGGHSFSSVPLQNEDGAIVHVLSDDGSFYLYGGKDPDLVAVEDSITFFGPQGDLVAESVDKLEMVDVQILAWCSKSIMDWPVPEVLEEILVLVHWKSDSTEEHTIYFLDRMVSDCCTDQLHWNFAANDIYFVKNRVSFERNPSFDQILTFINQSNFGNREFRKDCVVGMVVSTSSKQAFIDALGKRLSEEQRKQLYDKYVSGISRK